MTGVRLRRRLCGQRRSLGRCLCSLALFRPGPACQVSVDHTLALTGRSGSPTAGQRSLPGSYITSDRWLWPLPRPSSTSDNVRQRCPSSPTVTRPGGETAKAVSRRGCARVAAHRECYPVGDAIADASAQLPVAANLAAVQDLDRPVMWTRHTASPLHLPRFGRAGIAESPRPVLCDVGVRQLLVDAEGADRSHRRYAWRDAGPDLPRRPGRVEAERQ